MEEQLDKLVEDFKSSAKNLGQFIIDNSEVADPELTGEQFSEELYKEIGMDLLVESFREEIKKC